jgi:UDP-4-amino-4,6-dideoxy-N-acetyl-beta-L-altrosamine transaminase
MIPYGQQSITDSDVQRVCEALKSEWLTTGPQVEMFEEALEKSIGFPTITVSSGTAALHCAYSAIGIKPGDEVITPPITFVATQATASLLGAKIVFADVQVDTGNLDPNAVEAAISDKTKAIVAVDFAGHPADLNELRAIADAHNLFLIEDAAHSIGSIYKNRKVGSIADITTFSFFPTKNITTGEGGGLTSINPELLARAKKFARQGIVRNPSDFILAPDGPWHQEVQEFGLNYRLPDILCALGISQLEKLNEFKQKRNEIFEKYNALLKVNNLLSTPVQRDYVSPNWHLYPIRVKEELRRGLFEHLRINDIGVQVNYMPVHLQPVFRKMGFKEGMFPNAEQFYREEISLPMHVNILDSQIEFIASVVNSYLK